MKEKLKEAIELQKAHIEDLKNRMEDKAEQAKAGNIKSKEVALFYKTMIERALKVLGKLESLLKRMEG